MSKIPSNERRQRYFQLSSQLVQMDNAQLRHLFDSSEARAGWGRSHTLDIADNKVFVKRIPITELEYSNMFSTQNLYDLPTYYNYGVGSAGFSIFRELVAHVKTTNWVLNGDIETFPLLYHYRVMPFSGERIEIAPEQVERYVTYWGGNANIGQYRRDKHNANYELVLFLEHIPHVLEFWLMEHSAQIDDVLEQLRVTFDFLGQHSIIHFDANFDNILTDGERVYLTDFGLLLDRNFTLSEGEKAFFDAHADYDYGAVLSNLVYPIYELCKALPEHAQDQLRAKYGVDKEDNQYRQLFAVITENIAELHANGVINVDQAYVDCMSKYRDVCMLMGNFYLDLRANNQKDTQFPRAELSRLLKETGYRK